MALIDNIFAYWKLDETSSLCADSVGSLDLTWYNSPVSANGIIDNAID
ncbi:unnamed protein product, partial [marine sediment metagenome]